MAGIIINFAAGYGLAFIFYGKDIPSRQPIPSDITCFTDEGLDTHDDLLLKREETKCEAALKLCGESVNPFPNTSCPVYSCPEVECDCIPDFKEGEKEGYKACVRSYNSMQ